MWLLLLYCTGNYLDCDWIRLQGQDWKGTWAIQWNQMHKSFWLLIRSEPCWCDSLLEYDSVELAQELYLHEGTRSLKASPCCLIQTHCYRLHFLSLLAWSPIQVVDQLPKCLFQSLCCENLLLYQVLPQNLRLHTTPSDIQTNLLSDVFHIPPLLLLVSRLQYLGTAQYLDKLLLCRPYH